MTGKEKKKALVNAEKQILSADSKMKCPICKTEVTVGYGGIGNLENHQNSAKCKAKVPQPKGGKNSLFNVRGWSFKPKVNRAEEPSTHIHPIPLLTSQSGPVSSTSDASESVHAPTPIISEEPKELSSHSQRINQIQELINHLPPTVPEATEADLGLVGALESLPSSEEEIWEAVDRSLNRILARDVTPKTVSEGVRRGRSGTKYLVEWLVKAEPHIDTCLIEGKLDKLISGLEIL